MRSVNKSIKTLRDLIKKENKRSHLKDFYLVVKKSSI